MSNLQYCAGSGQQSDVWSERFDFPTGQPTYNDEWRLVATDLANDYYSNHDGWESKWPVEIRVYKDAECVGKYTVDLELEPTFYVI